MAYTKTTWTSGLPITIARLNNLEAQYDAVVADKGVANGFAGLGAGGKVPIAQLDYLQSLAANGYVKLPNGVYLQWGSFTVSSTSGSVTFPTAFPTACRAVSTSDGGVTNSYPAMTNGFTTTKFDYTLQFSTSRPIYWMAVGY